ncbi:MarR family transcriptional regulator [Phenylobacterium hankyongense]|uniref:MarR family transcriptional regulator n=1 Tax=Phenylobacterium hankyongense TaxID=1813876 RepID=A0A328ATY0_9CAUL|nr:MarR family winged helix-turn-helix transcriptional regulator [Phenylobacterium hankyongense]RAK58440.1 MarR family transcriptional regulator [Phenylobacterium hankyongense]
MPAAAVTDPTDIVALADALRPALLRVSRRLRQEAQKAGLSAQDALLLGAIKKNPGVGVSALADAERTSRPTMSGHIKRLEALGLVARSGDEADGRRSGLAITAAGARKLDIIRRQRNDWLAARLATLPAAERATLAAAAAPLLKLVGAQA